MVYLPFFSGEIPSLHPTKAPAPMSCSVPQRDARPASLGRQGREKKITGKPPDFSSEISENPENSARFSLEIWDTKGYQVRLPSDMIPLILSKDMIK